MLFLISQFRVYLIGHYKNIFVYTNFCNFLQILFFQNRACRVIRERQHQDLCLVRDRVKQLLRDQPEFIFLFQVNDNRYTSSQPHTGFIGNITGLGNQYFLTGIQHHTHPDIDGFGTAHRDQYLFIVIILQPLAPL